MVKVVITGARGFIGRNLVAQLAPREDVQVFGFDLEQPLQKLEAALAEADIVFHLAGVNRPESVEEFTTGNVTFTAQVCEILKAGGRAVPLVLSSSIQAERDNPYGRSKLQAEETVGRYAEEAQAPVIIYRLKNVFGKWCRPNYNSVVATFCHNIAHDLPITISDPANRVALVHVDDVVRS
ncbi:MAG: NAD-dependent epimerase/dehydratase family protein, partial [Anaerolineae bacterium]|nr:NAD-dependent epimerase/dehydratase family protein [Anaerolineae bacterium]